MIRSLKKWTKRYAVHLTAIVVMIVMSLGIAGYLLSNQRFYLPAWVPVIGTDFYVVHAEFESVQAVTPGQGQTVNIAGVSVGEISRVRLRGGRATIEMKIRRAYSPVYRDARLSIRPKTMLNDMYVDMRAGTPSAGAIADGGTVPLSQTKSTVNFEEFLSVLDADTRNYFQLLLDNAGKGLKGQGENLRSGFKRFAPTGKYGVRIVKQLQRRRKNIKRAISNLALLSDELGANSEQFASLIDSSSVNFRTWAGEQESIRQIIQKAPSALKATADAAEAADGVLADGEIALRDLEPLARDLGVSQKSLRPFFRDQTRVTRDSFRPFARESQPLLGQLKPASAGLAKLAPNATKAVKSFNNLLNVVAYNPPGSEEGYLYWLSWFSHLNASSISTQDANGPLRTGALVGSDCVYSAARTLRANPNAPMLKLLTGLVGLPDPEGPCV
ncbi:MAG: MlaD family protein [Solirubrobacterales bacterium]